MHPWEPYEIPLTARREYRNPYTEVDVWADLEGPGFAKRVHGFWRGGRTFAVRVTATAAGAWRWRTGANVDDPGLVREGSFVAEPWTPEELAANSLRHGFLEPTPNGRALQHADGTPFFLLGDTWWSLGTWRYTWRDSDEDHGIGPQMGLKEMTRYRRAQGYNCIAVIASLHAWANDGRPADIALGDGTAIRSAWANLTTGSAKDMHDSQGRRPFLFPGKVPGYEDVYPDVDRLNPAYFDELDTKIGYLNSQGFVVFLEPTRRDHSMAWKRFYDWPESYARFVHYVWSRYGAHHVILSPIHLDSLARSITPAEYEEGIDLLLDRYGMPPFARLISANPHESVRRCFGDDCRWLTLHMAGNADRRHRRYWEYVAGDFLSEPPRPCLNGEPHYAGWYEGRGGSVGGSPEDDLDVRSAMYGSVLCGGLAGHIYGANGLWGGDVEDYAKNKMWESIQWRSGGQMRHLRDFVLSAGEAYTRLVPHRELVVPNENGPAEGFRGWAFAGRTNDRRLFLLYFEPGCAQARVTRALPGATYEVRGFDPETGEWLDWAGKAAVADADGVIQLPAPPADRDLAMQLACPQSL